jgi:hypothetical protein
MTHAWMAAAMLIVGATMCFCQGGSNFSAFGLGDIRRQPGAFYDAMAGTSLAMPSTHGINLTNPALLGMSNLTRLQIGYRFNQHASSQGTTALLQNNGELDGLLALFGVDTARGFGIGFGLSALSNVSYLTKRSIQTSTAGGATTGNSQQLGEGGISALNLGGSYRLLPQLYVGVHLQTLFGTIRHSDQVRLDGGVDLITNTSTYDIRGLYAKLGTFWNVSPAFSVGASIALGTDASVNNTRSAFAVQQQSVFFDSTQVFATASPLPLVVGLGISFLNGKTRYGADIEVTDASAVTINSRQNARLETGIRATMGLHNPGVQSSLAPFFDRWGFRAGAGFQQMYYRVQNSSVQEVFGAAGCDFPLGATAIVDVAITAGYRWASLLPYTDLFGRATVSVSIGELWFRPFARD